MCDTLKDTAFLFFYSSGIEKYHNYKVFKKNKHLEQSETCYSDCQDRGSFGCPYTSSRENGPGCASLTLIAVASSVARLLKPLGIAHLLVFIGKNLMLLYLNSGLCEVS